MGLRRAGGMGLQGGGGLAAVKQRVDEGEKKK